LPVFNNIAGKAIRIDYWGDGFVLLALLAIVAVTGVLSGSYPALVISRFSPMAALKQAQPSVRSPRPTLRQGLVVFQFVISIALITAAIVISSQLHYIRHKNLGANIEQVVVVPYSRNAQALIHALKQNPSVVNASASSRVPVEIENFDTRPVYVEGFETPIQMENFNIDEDFLDTYQIELVAGRNLSREFGSDTTAFLLNESAVRDFGWGKPENALGKQIGWQFNFKNISLSTRALPEFTAPMSGLGRS
jgi:putative ABC transport system permease protein